MVVSKETPVFFVRPSGPDSAPPEKQDIADLEGKPDMLNIATPLIAVSTVMGMAPVLFKTPARVRGEKTKGDAWGDAASNPSGNETVHILVRSGWLEIYSVAVLGCITASSYVVFKASSHESIHLNTLANVLIYASGLLTATVVVLVQVATLWTTRTAIDSVEGLLSCENETQTMTSTRVRKARIWVAVQLALWASISTAFAGYHFLIEVSDDTIPISFCFGAYAVARPFMHMSCMQFANQAHSLSLQLVSINDRLLKMLGPVSAGLTPRTLEMWSRLGDAANPLRQPPLHPEVEAAGLETVRELRLLHHKMHVIAGYVQSAYGPQMLLVLLSTLLDYTTMLYILLARIEIGVTLKLVGLLIGTVHVLVMYLVLTSGNMVRQEAQRMGEIIQRGLVHRRLSERLVEELQDFSLQLVRLPTRLSACGLMYLDYSMIQGAVGTVTTYLVIMLQFPGSSRNQSGGNNKTTMANNSTG